jgi:ABC-type transport system substrate-binding protein
MLFMAILIRIFKNNQLVLKSIQKQKGNRQIMIKKTRVVSFLTAMLCLIGFGGVLFSNQSIKQANAAETTMVVTLPLAGADSSTSFTTATIFTATNSLKDATNGDFITTATLVDRVYAGLYGFKFGSASARGAFQFTVSQAITDVKLNLTRYGTDRKSTRLNSSHVRTSRMPSSA